jgi:hypothetical protein
MREDVAQAKHAIGRAGPHGGTRGTRPKAFGSI